MSILKVGLEVASAKRGWSPVAHIPALKSLKTLSFLLSAPKTIRID